MSERDKEFYSKLKADQVRYAEYVARKGRERRARQADKGYETGRKRRWRAANRDTDRKMRRAHRAVDYAIETGRLVRPKECSKCGATGRIEAHHHKGYAREHYLDVVWLCEPCHGTANTVKA
jgi:ribosomal protein S27AE